MWHLAADLALVAARTGDCCGLRRQRECEAVIKSYHNRRNFIQNDQIKDPFFHTCLLRWRVTRWRWLELCISTTSLIHELNKRHKGESLGPYSGHLNNIQWLILAISYGELLFPTISRSQVCSSGSRQKAISIHSILSDIKCNCSQINSHYSLNGDSLLQKLIIPLIKHHWYLYRQFLSPIRE